MKILILAAMVALSGCFGGSGGGTPNSDGPEMFSMAAADSATDSVSAAASYSAASYEPQNVVRVYAATQQFSDWHASLTQSQRDELSVQFIDAVIPRDRDGKTWVKASPTFHWFAGDIWWRSEGWEGIDKFALTYNQSIKAGSKKKGSMGSAPALLDVTSLSASSSEQIPASPEQGQETQFQSGTGRASYCRGKRCYR